MLGSLYYVYMFNERRSKLTCIVGMTHKGKVYIEGDFQVYEQEYYSVGSGCYHAMGSMYTSKRNSPVKDI